MFSCWSGVHPCKIPLKICDINRKRMTGIVAKSLPDLKNKIIEKLQLDKQGSALGLVLEDDGTEIDDDVLLDLPPHTILMVLISHETWTPQVKNVADDVERALSALLHSNHRQHVTEQIMYKIQTEDSPQMLELLGQLVSSIGQNVSANTRKDHPDWFKDQPASKKNKDSVMRDCAKRRIRKYYNTAIDHIKSKKNNKIPRQYQDILDNFSMELKLNDYYGDYFDRSVTVDSARICQGDGWFLCEGSYNVDNCSYPDHMINPYGSRANYVMFSTWNLDHGVEKSREILPQLVQAQDKKPKHKDLNWQYFYDLMFTRQNLKLVHTSCHDKSEHSSENCDPRQYYI